MNGTFRLIRRARGEGLSLKPAQLIETNGEVFRIQPAPQSPIAQACETADAIHTGSIYRELMQKHDRMATRHLK